MPHASVPMISPADAREKKVPLPKGYETVDSILLTEPRIEAIRRELQALLAVVELESNGQPVTIDGFRLRSIADWADYPTSLSDIFWHLSSACNFNCEFCYEKGNPPDFPIQNTPRMATPEEIATRLHHYDPVKGKGIFTVRTAINEPFANRHAVEYLKAMRAKNPNELISFVTNGSYLTEETVCTLHDLQPLFFNLSIYSTDPTIRRQVIRDFRGDRSVKAVELLSKYRIPYMTNLVMWPSIPFEDMERTISYMVQHHAVVIRVCLGGYSRYLRGNFQHFTVEEYWPLVVAEVERIRDNYDVPILIEPNSYVRRDTEALVDGVVQGSPAALAGVRRGDQILEVNGKRVLSRMQLLSELRRNSKARSYRPPGVVGMTGTIAAPLSEIVSLKVRRDGEMFEIKLDRYEPAALNSYPYGYIAQFNDFMFGLVLTDTLRYSSLLATRKLIEQHRAGTVLLLTSQLIAPILEHMLENTQAFAGLEVCIRVAPNNYFGGTINIGDLLVVQDIIDAVQHFCTQEGREPDLVLIPASPFASSPWGRDLTGRPWQDIERCTGIKVDLIPCPTITF